MPKTYSTYEAKARLSELLERVRKGDTVTITHRGQPIAEVRPIETLKEPLAKRLDELRRKGLLSRPLEKSVLQKVARRRGALRRFLESRE